MVFFKRAVYWATIIYIVALAIMLSFPVYAMLRKGDVLNLLWDVPAPTVAPLRVFLLRLLALIPYCGLYSIFVSVVIAYYFHKSVINQEYGQETMLRHVVLSAPLLFWWISVITGFLLFFLQGSATYKNAAGDTVHMGDAAMPGIWFGFIAPTFLLLPLWLRIADLILRKIGSPPDSIHTHGNNTSNSDL